jgi:hypothetical protein
MAVLGGNDGNGAEKSMEAYLEAFLGEVRIAQSVAGSNRFAGLKKTGQTRRIFRAF